MEFTDIKIFKEVADLKSTMKAAESLGYVQSNISKRVAKLEEEIGKKLFHRTNKGMTLTTDGEEFLPYAEALLRTITDLEKNFIAVPKKIRVGATQTITKNYLQDHFFDEQLVIFTNTSSMLIQQLKNHRLDVMILNKKLEEKSFIRTKIKEEPISWIKSKQNKQALQASTIVINRDLECPYRQATLAFFEQTGLRTSCIEVDTLDVMIDMLENHEAAAILPDSSIQSNEKLQKIEDYFLDPISIYHYQLKESRDSFELDLN